MNLENKTILVVGGAAGIGQATALLCAERGATVIVADFNETEGKATAQAANATFVGVDVTDEASVAAMCASIAQTHGKLDALVQTAGILKGAYVILEDFELATLRQVLDVNTVGSFLSAKHAAPLLKQGTLPAIILISSPRPTGSAPPTPMPSAKAVSARWARRWPASCPPRAYASMCSFPAGSTRI